MRKYGRRAKQAGVAVTAVTATEPHIGEAICKAVDQKNIQILVMGSRGLNKLSKVILGSVSQYCSENANCNVLIVKKNHKKHEKLEDHPHAIDEIEVESL